MKIINFKPELAPAFRDLNLEWLEHYFWVEPHDQEVLGDPVKHIIDPGGTIFFAQEAGSIIGTVALMPMAPGVYELTKMAVAPDHRGKKVGQKLMEHTLSFARAKGWEKLIIYSNRKLENAIYIYQKFGFREIAIGEGNPYSRGDIKMELDLC